MRLLLDTNILITVADDRVAALGQAVEELLLARRSDLLFSVASLWEIAIKSRLGKLRLAVPLDAIAKLFAELGLSLLDIRAAHVIAQAEPVPDTRDPFDRLLLGICAVEDMRLLTTDRTLYAHPLA